MPFSTRSSSTCLSLSVSIGLQKPALNQAFAGCLGEFIAFTHVVEYLLAEDEKAAIDPKIGVMTGANALNLAPRLHVDQMHAERWSHRGKASDPSARAEGLDHFREIDVGKPVAVMARNRHLFARRPEPFAEVTPDAGVDHGNPPVLLPAKGDNHHFKK